MSDYDFSNQGAEQEKRGLFGIGSKSPQGDYDFSSQGTAQANQPSTGGNPLSNLGKGLYKGTVYTLPQQLAQASQFLGIGGREPGDVAQSLVERGEAAATKEPGMFEQAGEMMPLSAGIPMALTAAGYGAKFIPHPIAQVASPLLIGAGKVAAFTTPAVFGLSQAEQTRAEALKRGVDPGSAPLATGAIEAAGETIGNIALMRMFGPLGKVGADIIGKTGAKRALQGTVLGMLKKLALVTAPTEILTEMGQNYGEALVEKHAGIRPEASPWNEAVSAIGPTAIMTALLGGGGGALNHYAAAKAADVLATPIEGVDLNNLTDESRAKVAQRLAYAKNVSEIIPKESEDLRQQWLAYAQDKIVKNLPIDIQAPLDSLSMQIDSQMDENPQERAFIEQVTIPSIVTGANPATVTVSGAEQAPEEVSIPQTQVAAPVVEAAQGAPGIAAEAPVEAAGATIIPDQGVGQGLAANEVVPEAVAGPAITPNVPAAVPDVAPAVAPATVPNVFMTMPMETLQAMADNKVQGAINALAVRTQAAPAVPAEVAPTIAPAAVTPTEIAPAEVAPAATAPAVEVSPFKRGKDFSNDGEYTFTVNGEKWKAYRNNAPGSLNEWYAARANEEFPKQSSVYNKKELIEKIQSGTYHTEGHPDWRPTPKVAKVKTATQAKAKIAEKVQAPGKVVKAAAPVKVKTAAQAKELIAEKKIEENPAQVIAAQIKQTEQAIEDRGKIIKMLEERGQSTEGQQKTLAVMTSALSKLKQRLAEHNATAAKERLGKKEAAPKKETKKETAKSKKQAANERRRDEIEETKASINLLTKQYYEAAMHYDEAIRNNRSQKEIKILKQTRDDIKQEINETKDELKKLQSAPQFSRGEGKGVPLSRAQAVVNKVLSYLKNPPKINFIEDLNAFINSEDPVGKALKAVLVEKNMLDENGEDNRTRGFTWPDTGEIYIVSGNMNSLQQVVNTLVHELTHNGLGRLLKDQIGVPGMGSVRLKWEILMDRIYKAHKAEIGEIAGDTHKHLNQETLDGRRRAAEEWLCNKSYEVQPQWYDKLVAIFHDALRALKIDTNISDAEVRIVLQDAFKEFGGRTGEPMFSRGIENRNYGSKIISGEITKPDIGSSMSEVTVHLEKTSAKDGRIDHRAATPKKNLQVAEAIAEMFRVSVKRFSRALTWYRQDVEDTMNILQEAYPALNKPENRFRMKLAIAISSNGQSPVDNVESGVSIFKAFSETNSMASPTGAVRSGEIEKGLALADRLGATFKNDKEFESWLLEKAPAQDTRDYIQRVFKISTAEATKLVGEEKMDAVLPRSVILGPKVGMFFANLSGIHDAVTMDRWFMRTLGRIQGILVRGGTKQDVIKHRTAFSEAIKNSPEGTRLSGIDAKSLKSTAGIDEAASTIAKLSKDKNYRGNLKAVAGGNDMRIAANALVAQLKGPQPIDTPDSGGHRQWLRDRVNQAREILKKEGMNHDNADIQAVIWVGEKELYKTFGVQAKKGDYLSSGAERVHQRVLGRPYGRDAGAAGRVDEGGRAGDRQNNPDFSRAPNIISKIKDIALNSPDGFTIDVSDGTSRRTGYAVAPSKLSETRHDILTEENLTEFLDRFEDVFKSDKRAFLGGWLDSKTNKFVLDVSFVVDNLEDALYIGDIGSQDAIFHLDNFEEIGRKDGIKGLKESGLYSESRRDELRGIQESVHQAIQRSRINQEYAAGSPLFSRAPGRIRDTSQRPVRKGFDRVSGQARIDAGTHYSNQKRTSLDSKFYGTGLSDAASRRVPTDPKSPLRHRIHFYYNPGDGMPSAERGVGTHEHNIDLSQYKIYDLSSGIIKVNRVMGEHVSNTHEMAVLKAGFDGIANPDYGVVVLLGKRVVPVQAAEVQLEPQFSRVTDSKLINKLESGEKIKAFRAMQVINGKLYPVMSARVGGKLREPTEIGRWEQAEENQEFIKNGKFTLDKANQSTVTAGYNPYFHASASPLNDQFTSAYKRENVVTVEVEIPKSELSSGYRAERAENAVGEVAWHKGVVSSRLAKMGKPRTVILSRYAKVVRIVPDSEVAKRISDTLKGTGLAVPDNTVTPSLKSELIKRGIKVTKTSQAEPQFDRAAGAAVTPGNNATWNAPVKSAMNTLWYTLVDKHADLRDVTKAIENFAGTIADVVNASLKETLFSGRVAKRVDNFLEYELKPILKELAERNIDLTDFEEYLHMRHVTEANAYVRTLTDDNGNIIGMQDGGSGKTDQEASDYMAALDPALRDRFEAMAVKIDAITKKNAQLMVEYNLESQETIDKWFGSYEHYVPLFRQHITEARIGTGTGLTVTGSITRKRKGSPKPVVNVLANIANQRERVIASGEKNTIATALYGLAKMHPNADFWKVIKPGVKKRLNVATKEMVWTPDEDYKKKTNVVMSRQLDPKTGQIIERGVEFSLENDRARRMSEAIRNIDMDNLGLVLSTSAKVTRFIASMNTQYNPIFGVTNFVRDVGTAMFNLTTTPIKGRQKEVMGYAIPALMGIYKAVRAINAGQPPTGEWARLFEEFQMTGGQTGYRDLYKTTDERSRRLEREIQMMQSGKAIRLGAGVFSWLSDYNTSMENAIRLSAYKVGIDSGMTKDAAAAMAKDLTVNFNRKGQVATQAGALYAFFNASAQGAAKVYETLTGPSGKRIIAGGLLFGVMQAAVLAAAGYDDEEPPEFVQEKNIIIPIGGGKYLTVPMPLGFNVLPNIGRMSAQFAMGGFKGPFTKMANLFGVILDGFNPLGASKTLLQTISPTPIDPLVALAENKDWTGKPIYREDFSSLHPTPGYTRTKDTATWGGKALSWGLNMLTGGTRATPGFFSPTPDQIDYLFGQATGGVGREAAKTQQSITSLIKGDDVPAHKVPLASRFFGSTTGESYEATKYYNNLKLMNKHEDEIKDLIKHRESPRDYIASHKEAKLWQMANKVESSVNKLRKQKRLMEARGASPSSIKAVGAMVSRHMKRFNEIIDNAK